MVYPVTKKKRLSYAELAGPQKVKWFVSHFWGTAFQHFTDAVCRHAQSACTGEWQQEPYWICSFSNNQHVSLLQRSPVISKILSIQDPMKTQSGSKAAWDVGILAVWAAGQNGCCWMLLAVLALPAALIWDVLLGCGRWNRIRLARMLFLLGASRSWLHGNCHGSRWEGFALNQSLVFVWSITDLAAGREILKLSRPYALCLGSETANFCGPKLFWHAFLRGQTTSVAIGTLIHPLKTTKPKVLNQGSLAAVPCHSMA